MTSLHNGDKTVPRAGHVRTLLTRDFDGWGGGVTARCRPAADAASTPPVHHRRASKAQRRNLRVKTNRDKTFADRQFEIRVLYRETLK